MPTVIKPNTNYFTDAAHSGLRVFPVINRDKKPALPWKQFADQEPTANQLADWDAGDYNLGVITGSPSGIAVLDVDSPEAQTFVEGLNLPSTPAVSTGRGTHYYFKLPAGGVRNTTKIGGHKLDLRGDGGYVVGHGSIHESGRRYEWLVSPDEVPFAEFPPQLLALLKSSTPTRTVSRAPASDPGEPREHVEGFGWYLGRELKAAVEAVRSAAEGKRNDTLFQVGVGLAKHVAGADADWAPFADPLGQAAIESGLAASEVEGTLASCWKAGSIEPMAWMVTARQWVYLSYPDVFYHLESGQHLRIVAFNNNFASQTVVKGTLSSFLLRGDFVTRVYDLDYCPMSPDRFVRKDGLVRLNTYRPSDVEATAGDWSWFADFISYLVPDEKERDHLLRMMAWTVRNPGCKLRHALLLRSEHQGVGKTMLTDIWTQLLGAQNVRKTTTEEVSSQFQGFIKETMLVVLEELNWGVGPIGYNRMKDLITGDIASVNEKYMPVRHWPNVASFVILTNLRTPFILEDTDRRIFYVDSPAVPREAAYYRDFAAWWQDNPGVIRAFLDTIDLADFNPHAPAPMTSAKQGLIVAGRSDLIKDLTIAIEDRSGVFDRDVMTLEEIERELGSSMRGKTKSQLRDALRAVGGVSLGQQRVPGLWQFGSFTEKAERASLWAIRNARFWVGADAVPRGEEYRRQEGIFAHFHEWPILILHAKDWPADPALMLPCKPAGKPLTIVEKLDVMVLHAARCLPV